MALPSQKHPAPRVLDAHDRISEILFGLIMVLTFTGSLSAGESGRGEVRQMLVGALGCNLAWGVIDAILYLMGCVSERVRGDHMLRAVQGARDADAAHRALREVLPDPLAGALGADELEAMRRAVLPLPAPPAARHAERADYRGALAVFLLVFLSMFPVVVPFLVMHDLRPALRVSNLVAVVMLFLLGQAYGRVAGQSRWWTGVKMVVLGCALVGMTIALGG